MLGGFVECLSVTWILMLFKQVFNRVHYRRKGKDAEQRHETEDEGWEDGEGGHSGGFQELIHLVTTFIATQRTSAAHSADPNTESLNR